jgi:protein involved in polysaccharide export with SLBB domain
MTPGAVDNPGNMTATRAIMAAGGFRNTAELSSVVVLRDNGGSDPIFMSIDIGSGLEWRRSGDVYLQPYDVVFVPPTTITRMNQAVKQYITDLIPIDFQVNYSWIENGFVP